MRELNTKKGRSAFNEEAAEKVHLLRSNLDLSRKTSDVGIEEVLAED